MFHFPKRASATPFHPVRQFLGPVGTFAAIGLVLALQVDPSSAISSRRLITATGGAAGDAFGNSVSSAGDLNGDGYPDLAVGAKTAGSTAGAVYVFFGGPGLHATPDVVLTDETSSYFGDSVASAGDVNGDGYADLIVGALTYGGTTGRVYVFYGGPTFVSKGAASADVILTGEASSYFGYSVSAAGDVNGDGRADVIVGAPWYTTYTGRAYIFYGGSTFVSKPAANANVILTGEATNTQFGFSVSGAGDLNGDGRGDVVVGGYLYGSFVGRAYVFYGGNSLVSKPAANADVILAGEAGQSYFGFSVATAGDVNGDGRPDLIIGSPAYNNFAGRAYIFYGGALLVSKPAASADVILSGEVTSSQFGYAVSTAGDVNGDGRPDLIIGDACNCPAPGQAYIFFGGSLYSKPASTADIILSGEANHDFFGASVSTAGDVNGDGYADVIIGAFNLNSATGAAYVIAIYPYQVMSPNGGEQWTAGQPATVRWLGQDAADISLSLDGGLSWATLLSGVGGLADNTVTVIAPTQSSSGALVRVSYNGQYVTHATSDRSDRTFSIAPPLTAPVASRLQRTFTGAVANDQFGWAVSQAGDVNGDGYPDLIVGVPNVNGGAGAVNVYFGPIPHATPDVVFTGETGSALGVAVSSGGDVNGDGIADIIAGAFSYPNLGFTGRTYIFFGGSALASKPATNADVILTGESTGSYFGYSVSTAGDANRDGYADVMVGAYGYSSGVGRAYVFYGGPSLVSKPAGGADVILTGESASGQFGCSVSGAGDMNGDGRAEVIVGASGYNSNTGRAYVFYGGSTLLSKPAGSADVILTGESASGQFGYSVSGAGDMNGDGRAEVIISAQAYNSFTGRAYVFYGGSTLYSKPAGSADVILTGEGTYSSFGRSVSLAGDVNGDGRPDLIVGAPFFASNTGRAYLFYGGPSLASKGAVSADLILNGEAVNTYFGLSVSGAGDMKQDGFGDVVVGAYGYSAFRGRAYLYDVNRYQLLSPIGGDTWNVGATKSVSWLGAEPADLWLSVDGGGSYSLLDHNVGGAALNAVAERVPHQPTRFARVKLTPADSRFAGSARSDSLFTIQTSVGLLGFGAQQAPGGGTYLTWSTNPAVGPEGISGYRLYRVSTGAGATGVRIGPDPITETHYTDGDGTAGSSYRLSAVNGLGEELELGEVSLGSVRALWAWPLPYRAGDLHVSFSIIGPLGATAGTAEVGLYDLSGRLVKMLARGSFDGRQQTVTWDGRDAHGSAVAAGVYFLRAKSGGQASHIKLTVMR